MVAELEGQVLPQAPLWKQRQQEQGAPTTNRNINDMYWRKPDGWIAVGPSFLPGIDGKPLTAQSETKRRLGWEPLPAQYSYTDRVSTKTGQRDTIELSEDRLNTPDKFYWFFVNGGAPLFPIEQIVAYHWHITPPFGLPKSVFPQLDEWEVPEPYWCPVCPPSRPNHNSPEEVNSHLLINHRLTQVQCNDLYNNTNGFLDKARGGSAGVVLRRKAVSARAPKQEEPTEQPRPRLLICNDCGERIEGEDNMAKARHARNCPARTSSPAV